MEGKVIRPDEEALIRQGFLRVMLRETRIAAKNPSRYSDYQIARQKEQLEDILLAQRNSVPRAVPKKKSLSFKKVVEELKERLKKGIKFLKKEDDKVVVEGKSESPTKSKGGSNTRKYKYTNITKKPKKKILTKKPKKKI